MVAGEPTTSGDDADVIVSHESGVFVSSIEHMDIVGIYPWEERSEPHVMFHYPRSSRHNDSICQFIFPDGCSKSVVQYKKPSQLLSDIFQTCTDDQITKEVHYFKENTKSPLMFCYKVKVNPITIPVVAHSLKLSELMEALNFPNVPFVEICIAIQTKFPYNDYFDRLVLWLLNSEGIARMAINEILANYPNTKVTPEEIDGDGGSLLAPTVSWPASHRDTFSYVFETTFSLPVPGIGMPLTVDYPPFPQLYWERPDIEPAYMQLLNTCLRKMTTSVTPELFAKLLNVFILEYSIVIYSSDLSLLTHTILALHYLLRPLRWVGASISVLPSSLMDIMSSPSPVIVGVNKRVSMTLEREALFDLDARKFTIQPTPPMHPHLGAIQKQYKKTIGVEDNAPYEALIDGVSQFIKELMDPVEFSIVSNCSDIHNVTSKFLNDMYLSGFAANERKFMDEFVGVQLFRFYVEQACRKRSDTLKK